MQPFRELHWWKWMYHLSPFTYVVEGLTGASKWLKIPQLIFELKFLKFLDAKVSLALRWKSFVSTLRSDKAVDST